MTDCLSDSDLHRYHAKELDLAGEARVREHLAECEACAGRSAELVAGHDDLLGRIKAVAGSDTTELAPPKPPSDAPPGGDDPRRGGDMDQPQGRPGGVEIEGYEILRELHRGGQGVVYQAVQRSTRRKVAVKVLLEGPYASKSARRRFEREIELVASLKHPNIISVFHSGETSDGRQFCVMDYVRGVPLHEHVRDKQLTLEQTLKLFATVCDAVNYAHRNSSAVCNVLVGKSG